MKSILVIDDDAAIRALLSRALTFSGYQVTEAASGADGARALETHPPDLVVTDIIMPDTDGLEFLFRARARWKGIPIVAISGGGRLPASQYLRMAQMAGANATFEKPLDLEALVGTVGRLLTGLQPG